MLKLICLRDVEAMAGIRKTEIYQRMKAGTFPKPAKVGAVKGTRWEAGEVQAWIKLQLEARDQAALVTEHDQPPAPGRGGAAQLLAA